LYLLRRLHKKHCFSALPIVFIVANPVQTSTRAETTCG